MKKISIVVLIITLVVTCIGQDTKPKTIPLSKESRAKIQSIQRDINNLVLQMQNIVLTEQVEAGKDYEFSYEDMNFHLKEKEKKDVKPQF